MADRAVRAGPAARALVRRRRVLPARHAGPGRRAPVRPDGGRLRRRPAHARLAAPAARLLRRGRDARPGPVRAAAAAPPHPGHRPARRRPGQRARAGDGAHRGRSGGHRRSAGRLVRRPGRRARRGRRAAGLPGRGPRADQRVRHDAAVPPGTRPGGRAARRTGRPARAVAAARVRRGAADRLGPAGRRGPGGRLDAVRRAVDGRRGRGRGAGRRGGGEAADRGRDARRTPVLVVAVAGVGDGGHREQRPGADAARRGRRRGRAVVPPRGGLGAAGPVRRARRPRVPLLVAGRPPAGQPDHRGRGRCVRAGDGRPRRRVVHDRGRGGARWPAIPHRRWSAFP